MASTADGRRLSEAHRLAQARLGAQSVASLLSAFDLLDPENLDGSVERWLRVVLPVIRAQQGASQTLAANYMAAFRRLELPGVRAVAPVLAGSPEAAAVTSMMVTGPVSIRAGLERGLPLARVLDVSKAKVAGAGLRHVLSGGRDTVARSVQADPKALGWARATSGRTCSFCAMLAGRGPVYSERTVEFEAHDHCSCGAEPVYRELPRDQWPPGSAEARDLYDEVAAGLPPAEARTAFRQAWESGQRPPAVSGT